MKDDKNELVLRYNDEYHTVPIVPDHIQLEQKALDDKLYHRAMWGLTVFLTVMGTAAIAALRLWVA